MNLNKQFFSMLFLTLLVKNISYAAPFPRGCEADGFGYNNTNLVVNYDGKQSYYLIQNHSNSPVQLQRVEMREMFMSPPLTAKLDPANWAAFASDIEQLHFQCFYVENNNTLKVPCRDVLEVCRYPRVKFALSNMGNYWVSINKEQQKIISDSTAKGIYLKW